MWNSWDLWMAWNNSDMALKWNLFFISELKKKKTIPRFKSQTLLSCQIFLYFDK